MTKPFKPEMEIFGSLIISMITRIMHVVFVFVFSIVFMGCNLFFDKEETSLAQLKSFTDYEDAINGVYGILNISINNNRNIDYFYANLKADDLSIWGGFRSDYYITPENYIDYLYNSGSNSCNQIGSGYNQEDGTNTSYTWNNLYKTIVSANNIIGQYPAYKDDGKIYGIIGEAYLIRAYCYFRLTHIYGEIPLIEDTDVNFTVPKSPFVEIYELIEYDLMMAKKFLPSNNDSARIPFVTPHKGTVGTILAELYLCWAGYPVKDYSKYEMAMNTASTVIDSMDYFGMGLVDDFAGLWGNNNLYNKEAVFSVYSNKEKIRYFNVPESKIFDIYNGSYYYTEYEFYNHYPKNYRRDITFINKLYYITISLTESGEYYVKVDSLYIDKALPCVNLIYRKFNYFDIFRDKNFTLDTINRECYGNQRFDLYRFAHTLLTYSEAAARCGHLDSKAYECVNMIRRRANHLDLHTPSEFDLKPGLSAEAFIDSVVAERGWELAGEPEGRWFDLIRLEKVEDLPQLRGIRDIDFPFNKIVTKEDYYFPIPQGDILLNPALGK